MSGTADGDQRIGDRLRVRVGPLFREVLTVMAAVAVAATALVVSATPRAAGDDADAETFLQMMSGAGRATYHARQLVVYLGSPQSAAVVEIRSTPRGTFVRSEAGADVTRVWKSQARRLVVDDEVAVHESFPLQIALQPADVLDKYEVDVETVPGGAALVPLALVRRMDRRLVERLWVHRDNGMVYRRELYGTTGELIGLQTTLDMRWGDAGRAESWDEPKPKAVEVKRSADAPERLPYSYRLLRSYELDVKGEEAEHWVYSDGLHMLSVFRRPGSMELPDGFEALEGDGRVWSGPGPGTWAWEGDGHTWLAVAEEPQLDPIELLEPLPKGGPSIWARLGSWWARAWHWLVEAVS